ncbi:hypothetical protein [uncultured Cohaesibacter sp.]|uniref:hypothetical protein n=1 Tax=uncultured Cohaesibacter sp. TaxID=1002546 RepID=UPI002AA76282|nr:hypothetical protein [uncultured Cohaesibacter sp.]
MGMGLSLLNAVITDGNRQNVTRLNPSLFTPEEMDAYDTFTNHYRRYGELPSITQMREQGFQLPSGIGQLEFQFDRGLRRSVYNRVMHHMPAFQGGDCKAGRGSAPKHHL